jgi:hypothetical protein
MRDLVVCHCKHFGSGGVQHFVAIFHAHLQPTLATNFTVDVNGAINLCDAVLGQNHDLSAVLLREIDQLASYLVDLLQRLGHCWVIFIGAKTLHVVIEVRQIDQGERGIKVSDGQLGGFSIQREEAILVLGPQKLNSGNLPVGRLTFRANRWAR